MAPILLIGAGLVFLYAVASGKGRVLWDAILGEHFTVPPSFSGGGTGGPNQGGGGGSAGGISYTDPGNTQPFPPGTPLEPGSDPLSDPLQVNTAPTITAGQIDSILSRYHSPAAGMGAQIYALGVQYGINPAVALAFFNHETSLGTDYGSNAGTNSWGNIRCTSSWTQAGGHCINGWRAYPTFVAAAADWYALIRNNYVNRGLTTVDTILPVYAPSFENDTRGYIAQVKRLVRGWGRG